MKKAKIITMISTAVLIAGLVMSFVTSKKYTREIYFKTPEEAINYFIDNYDYMNIDKVKDVLTARNYYESAYNNYDYLSLEKLKTQSYTLKKMNNEQKMEETHGFGEHEVERLKDKEFEIYYIRDTDSPLSKDNELKYIDSKFRMIKDGEGWVLDKFSKQGIYK